MSGAAKALNDCLVTAEGLLAMATLTPRAACALRLMLAWALLSGLGFWHGETLFAASTALMTEAVHWIEPRLASSVQLTTASADAALVLDASVAMPLALDNERAIPTGTAITPQMSVAHALVPLLILLSVSLAVPVRSWRERALGVAIAAPFAWAFAITLAVFHLLGLVEMDLQTTAESLGITRPPPLLLSLLVFMEGGGRWLLALLAGVLPTLLARRLLSPAKARQRVTETSSP
jgi:hypothetical protein